MRLPGSDSVQPQPLTIPKGDERIDLLTTDFARRAPLVRAAALALVLALPAHPALAQDASSDARVRRLEAEVRALQRRVFAGGDGGAFQPEITRPAAAPPTGPAQPTTSAVTDLLTRMDAIEGQMTRLTAQTEQNGNRIAQLEANLSGPPQPAPAPSTPAASAPAANLEAVTGSAPAPRRAPNATSSSPSAQRLEAVRAIPQPQTSDAADDAYSYGFRLWDAKFYPEAAQQLRLFVDRYPRHSRISYARNLLGRAYLDDGNPREAAKWFLQNYQADKAGARAPDSLLFLARSMNALGDGKRGCIALAEFAATYAGELAGRLKGDYDATRRELNCG